MPIGVYLHTKEQQKHAASFVPKGKKNVLWKGDNVKYQAIHSWIRKQKGSPKRCELCGKTEGYLEWASKDGTHKRRLNHYFGACRRCHDKYDKVGEKIAEANRKRIITKESRVKHSEGAKKAGCGKWMLGRKMSIATRKKISDSMKKFKSKVFFPR
jgi:hypothetical protein